MTDQVQPVFRRLFGRQGEFLQNLLHTVLPKQSCSGHIRVDQPLLGVIFADPDQADFGGIPVDPLARRRYAGLDLRASIAENGNNIRMGRHGGKNTLPPQHSGREAQNLVKSIRAEIQD